VTVPALGTAASLCTDLGRVKDLADLTALLGRAADLMDASGLIVWLGSPAGGDLSPVLAHGYPEQTLARIPPVPRSANNAAAAAYRTGTLQMVVKRQGTSRGALVAPLLASGGCIGALTAEIRDGGETSETTQALATIVAAQLTGVLSASVETVTAGHTQSTETAGRVATA
jgi:GAF domain-containing protein